MGSPRKQLGRDDWLVAALDRMPEHGLSAFKIPRLCEDLGVTKGSFYHHFKDQDDLVRSALERWTERETLRGIRGLELIGDPRERLRTLFKVVLRRRDRGAVMIAMHGEVSDPRFAEAVRAVNETRVAFLRRAYRDMGFDERDAAARAMTAYSIYVGLHQVLRTLDEVDAGTIEATIAHMTTQLVPAASSSESKAEP